MKRLFVLMLSAAILISCGLLPPAAQVNAAETDSRVYVTADQTYFESLITAKKAPTKDGYLFAGWVAQKSDGTGVAIKSKDDAVLKEDGVTITAKFIPAHLAGVACQISANTYQDGISETQLRMVSCVDNGEYQVFGFNLYERILVNAEKLEYQEYKYAGYTGTVGGNLAESTTRYTGMYVWTGEEKAIKTPVDIFGAEAEGFYFITARLTHIPRAFYDSSIFVIRPYWVTADGTYVEGLAEYDRVSDGKNGIVNISVNIKEAEAIAAGRLSVQYDPNQYEYASADVGRVFEEMQIKAEDGTVSCVGNVADMRSNAKTPNDIYINLRFKKLTEAPAAGLSTFTVAEKDFCNKDEGTAQLNIGNVKY